MSYDAIASAARAAGLSVMGALDEDGATLVLLGAGPAFWPVFRDSPEASDGAADPIDRWSSRVIGAIADTFGARAVYPFGGPPYAPFIKWALASGRAFQSPTGMLVHDEMGLMISYRGAVQLSPVIDFPAPQRNNPCITCVGHPCTTACPVDALSQIKAYDVGACHDYLDTTPGQACLTAGCAVRRACPVSQGAGRTSAQSALHMKAFHPP